MNTINEINLTPKEQNRKKIILQCLDNKLSTKQAAFLVGISQRRIQQEIKDYKLKGDLVFAHGNRGITRINPQNEERKQKIADIFLNTRVKGCNPYFDMNYKFFTEILKDKYQIKASEPYVKKNLNWLGHSSPIKRKSKKKKQYHLERERKKHFGELIQADGKMIDLFNNGHIYCIQGFVDDATGYPVGLYITKNECLLGYIEALRNMLTSFGVPQQMYPDKASVFFVNKPTLDNEKHLTQFGVIMEELGVDMFPAHSPQAKGRIERFWQTLQWRLPQILCMNGIQTVEEANEFLRTKFYKIWKESFPKPPKSDESYFVKPENMSTVTQLLKATFPAKIDKGGVFSFMGYRFLTTDLPDEKICIHINEVEGMWITKVNNQNKRYKVKLCESDTSGRMPEVFKNLIERIFLKNAKPKFREVYIDVDDVVYSQIKPKKKKIA